MSHLFDFGRTVDSQSGGDYGLSGDMKKTQYVLQLLGSPADADTLKCLMMAVEVGLETDCDTLDIYAGQDKGADYRAVSPFGLLPTLKEADYYVSGEFGVMSYIEARGLGKRLRPQNAVLLAEQSFWSDVACSDFQPHMQVLLNENLLKSVSDSDYKADDASVEKARAQVRAVLEELNKQLDGREFIIGSFSFADIHWGACVHLLDIAGESALIDACPNVKAWFAGMRQHKSFSGQNIVAFDLLPTRDDIIQQKLKSVIIDDY